MNKFPLIITGIASLLALAACASLPQSLSEGERATIATAGGKSELLQHMLSDRNNQKIDSILVYKDGRLVLQRYANGYGAETVHDIRSATKAITSLLVGIAIDQGMIQGEDESILDFFPERRASHPNFGEIRIRDLLSMSSGLDSDDWVPSSPGNEEKMYATRSWIDFFFSLPLVDKPGTRFRYSSAGVVLLGELLKRASGMELDSFAEKYLFRDLGIVNFKYAKTAAGETDSGGHLKLTPQDFAKIGLLTLQNGKWQGKQLVPKSWVQKINQPRFLVPGVPQNGPYMGYLWWQEPVVDGEVRSYQARGNGGQYLIAVPSLNLLAVFTGSAFNDNQQLQPFLLMRDFIIPAFKK